MPYRFPNYKENILLDPHVVIVGAGASKAACSKDKNGQEVPLLKDIHKILGLTKKLKKYNFSDEEMEDFEVLYSKIYEKKEYEELQTEIENAVFDYFSKLEIPDEPTLYDYLILSLTDKDAIISFNWDPFLMQAYRRNILVKNLPELIFPHGNVGVGLCKNCKVKGYANCLCPNCFNNFENMPLLYPTGRKDYNKDEIIKNEWNRAKAKLSMAAGITVYGYGAPVTDIEAVELMKTANTISHMKEIAPFTIINIAEREKEQIKWKEFYDVKMMLYCNKLEDSLLWQNPRASLETIFAAILQQQPSDNQKSFKKFSTLYELQEYVKTL